MEGDKTSTGTSTDESVDTSVDATQTKDTEVTDDSVLEALKSDDDTDMVVESDDTEQSEEDDSDESEDESDDEGETDGDSTTDESPQERARREYQERVATRQDTSQRQNLIRQQQAEEYIQQAEDEKDAAIRQLQAENYYTRIQNTEAQIVNDFDSAIREIDLFNPASDQYNQAALSRSLATYEKAYMQSDDAGNVTGYSIPLKQFLQEEAALYSSLVQNGATKGQQAERKMRSKVEPLSTKAPSKPKSDPILDVLKSDD